ncbi:DoxX family membrane protein [uncultured Maribacter sp.]|uniref:DoxX family membrane protein n=1 Tax=uncultured Maribacter sp. TaxID=431308 RepID=UPI00260F01F1|nr:DoxX family membrane protein [uncultured Maribacter sp.]
MIKTILLILLGLFFILNGINHIVNTHIYEEYSVKRGLVSPRLMVQLSSIVLIFDGATLMFNFLIRYGVIGLSIFLIIASFSLHQFWKEKDNQLKLLESMHFAKNMAILTELIYIAYS